MVRNKYVGFALFVVVALIIWNLLDYLYSTFITRSVYQFTVGGDLGFPFIGAVVVGYLLFLHKRQTNHTKLYSSQQPCSEHRGVWGNGD